MFEPHPILSRLMPVDLRSPVNRWHPLNRGRVAWWLTLRGWYGGQQLYDLMGLNHGTLTNMTSTSGWRPTVRKGGFGHLLFDGSDDYVTVPSTPSLTITGPITVAAWVYSLSKPSAYTPFLSREVAGSSAYYLGWNNNAGTTGAIYFGFRAGANEITATAPSVGAWHRVVGTFDGAGMKIYIDGVLASSGGNSTAPGNYSVATRIGSYAGPPATYFNGRLDDLGVWNRNLFDAEVASDYQISRAGYAGVLNRIGMTYGSGGGRIGNPLTASFIRGAA